MSIGYNSLKNKGSTMNEVQLKNMINSCEHTGNISVSHLFEDIDHGVDVLSRKSFPRHLTASAALYSKSQGLLAIKHKALGLWLLPGGHIDEGELPLDAAIRELKEETGVILPKSAKEKCSIIEINSHSISENTVKKEPEHTHFDVRYLFIVESIDNLSMQEEEIDELKFVPLNELGNFNFSKSVRTVTDYLKVNL
ncbi:NUDIX domain-containing protein [Photobacterium sp. GJ3]|uniref:NUDIX hydrolase n=1 Tax=Photobacterium sp. GJ3 TaxID=2829502 RepID=UPI001B8B6C68|nr:NUDIX domain-containing protein [Photobacterium sp. GJ3]QUJ67477.1 NUDIX domain-containing protein [Photobacterium sp. GJ3]